MLEIAYGNITQEEATRLGYAAGSVDDVTHRPGSAEPWVSRLVHAFIIAIGARTVLEAGSFRGGTSAWIMDALSRLGGGVFHMVEIDPKRMEETVRRIGTESHAGVRKHFHTGDVLDFLRLTTNTFDLAWVDDNHEKEHVRQELTLLYPKMNPGGIILGHDVWGWCDLQEVFREHGGFSLNLPRLGAAGGIGMIQVPHPDSDLTVTTPWRQMG